MTDVKPMSREEVDEYLEMGRLNFVNGGTIERALTTIRERDEEIARLKDALVALYDSATDYGAFAYPYGSKDAADNSEGKVTYARLVLACKKARQALKDKTDG